MTISEYQKWAKTTAVYEHDYYPFASLMIESSEFADLFAKPMLRGDDKTISVDEIKSEAGDVLWNLVNCLSDLGVDIQDVLEYNHSKIEDRKRRGVIKGDGGVR